MNELPTERLTFLRKFDVWNRYNMYDVLFRLNRYLLQSVVKTNRLTVYT
jgi:hypothetical protein